MSDTITLRGYVATELRQNTTDNGLAVASFRMCTTERRYDRDAGSWLDGQTNWYAVSLFRQLATNAAFSIHKGDRVLVTGRLRLRQWATEDGRSGTSADIDADTVGHDLMWGTASFRRTVSGAAAVDRAREEDTDHIGGDADLTDSYGRLADPLTGELPDTDPDSATESAAAAEGSAARTADKESDRPRENAAAPF